MAINGVKPGSQEIGDVASVTVSEPKVTEVEKVSIQTTTDNIGAQTTQVASATTDNQQLTDEQLDKKLRDAISMANNKLKQAQPSTRCEFTYHEEVNRVSIKLIDKDTKNVVKEIPTEKTIKMLEKLWEVAGLLVDEKL
ncbi:flagellar protein FlaG [Anaerosporobacter sp.]|uniref:flagellar protein FlaG n=1 Tax=Anaerosporobacter sp. TaxID=1872529 RepID=UPI00286FA1ED|nr:flagellar protein FlaG [Anaerosporobacter sp.]